jgi:flotillin
MVSTGSGEVGAAKLTGEVLAIVSRIPELVKQMTNIDISRVNQNHKYI